MTERERALLRVQTLGFAMNEANLFLDTHPTDRDALDYYHKTVADYTDAVQQYITKYGPIDASQVQSRERWTWVDGCMPWEADCNVEL